MSNDRDILMMSVVLAAAILNIVLYNVDYSAVKHVPGSSVLSQALGKFILPSICPSPSPHLQMLQVAVGFIRLAHCCLSSCDLYTHSVTSVAFCFSLVLPSPNLHL